MATLAASPVLSAGTMIGDSVKNLAGEKLGTIKEIMIDTATGRVAYAVLSFGGFLGMGDKLFAVPYQALHLRADDECFELDIDKERLENAHGFDKNNWPDFAEQQWQAEVHSAYGFDPMLFILKLLCQLASLLSLAACVSNDLLELFVSSSGKLCRIMFSRPVKCFSGGRFPNWKALIRS